MYKVFFNECLILLDPENKNSLSDNIVELADIQYVGDFFDLVLRLEDRKYVEKPIYKCLIEKDLIPEIIKTMTQIWAAGGIVRNLQNEILFIRRLGRWDLPKGKIEDGEQTELAAIREVEEECGIRNLHVIRKLPSTFHIYRSPYLPEGNNWVWKETSWFEMFYSGSEALMPQTEEDITEVRWFPETQLAEVYQSTYGSLRELLINYLA